MRKKIEIRKRGRPPKNVKQQAQPQKEKKKRGRPPKIKTPVPQKAVEKKRRGRPPKKIDKIITPLNVVKLKKFDYEFEAKLFLNTKPSSKQIPEYDKWYNKYQKLVEEKKLDEQIKCIRELEDLINGNLDKDLIQLSIPPVYLMKGDKVAFVVFEPFDKGIEVSVKYNSKVVPMGASVSVKQTTVCNKINEIINKILPIGVCY